MTKRNLIRTWPMEAKNEVKIRKKGLEKHKRKRIKWRVPWAYKNLNSALLKSIQFSETRPRLARWFFASLELKKLKTRNFGYKKTEKKRIRFRAMTTKIRQQCNETISTSVCASKQIFCVIKRFYLLHTYKCLWPWRVLEVMFWYKNPV